jgi:hypothetical protein
MMRIRPYLLSLFGTLFLSFSLMGNPGSASTLQEKNSAEAASLEWGGFVAGSTGYINTGDWLGWLYIERAPWMWHWGLNNWIFARDPGPNASGVWVYVPRVVDDGESPSIPGNVISAEVTADSIGISWDAATDNIGVSGYRIYVNGGDPIFVTETSVLLAELDPETTYTIQISAVDAAGNESAKSVELTETTSAAGPLMASSVTIDGRTFTFNGTYEIVHHVDGPVAIVSSTAVVVTPPPTETLEAKIASGTMVNPQYRGGQAFDERRPDWDGTLLVSSATTLAPGDIMLSSISRPTYEGRSGTTARYQMVYVTAEKPASSSLAPAAIGWTGRSSLEIEGGVDWEAQVSKITARTITANVRYSHSQIAAGLSFNPGLAHYNATSSPGYEWSMPWLWGGAQNVDNSNWGGYTIRRMNNSFAVLHDDAYTLEERADVLARLASFGKQTWQTLQGADISIFSDGGHSQFQNVPMQLYFWATGQDALLDTLFEDYGGNYIQAIRVDEAYYPNLAPFGDPDVLNDYAAHPYNPWMYHWRRVVGVSGDTITVTTSRGYGNIGPYSSSLGDEQKGRYEGLLITDGTDQYLVTGRNGDIARGESTTSFEVAGHTFEVGDAVHFLPDYTVSVGDTIWGISGLNRPHSVILTTETSYAPLQRWTAGILTMFAIQQAREEYRPAIHYTILSNREDYPTAAQDYTNMYDPAENEGALWLEHGAAILAIPQPHMGSEPFPDL